MNPSFAFLLAATVASSATAQDASRVVLRYERVEGSCPDEPAMRRLVAERLGWDPFVESAPDRFTVRMERLDEGVTAHISIDRDGVASGERTLTSSELGCDTLTHHVVLALAIAIDPAAWLEGPDTALAPGEGSTEPTPPSVREPAAMRRDVWDPERPPGLPREAPPAVVVRVGVGAVAGVGATPEVSGGGRVELTVALEALVLGLDVELTHAASALAEGRVESLLLAADAFTCARVSWVSMCGVGRGGALFVRAAGFAPSLEQVGPIGSVGVRLAVAIPLGEVDLQLAVDVAVSLTRTSFLVEGERAWRSEPVVGQLALSLLLRDELGR